MNDPWFLNLLNEAIGQVLGGAILLALATGGKWLWGRAVGRRERDAVKGPHVAGPRGERGPATYDQAVSVVLTSRARPRLTAPAVDEHEPIEHTGSGDTYEAAKSALEEQLSEGWVLLGIGRV